MSKGRYYSDYNKPNNRVSPTGIESPLKNKEYSRSPIDKIWEPHGKYRFRSKKMSSLFSQQSPKDQAIIDKAHNDLDAPGYATIGMGRLGKGKYSTTQGTHMSMLKEAYNGLVPTLNGVFALLSKREGLPLQQLPFADSTLLYDDNFRLAIKAFQINLNLDNQEGAIGPETLQVIDALYLILEKPKTPVNVIGEEEGFNFLTAIYAYFEANATPDGTDAMYELINQMHNKKEKKLKKNGEKLSNLLDKKDESEEEYERRRRYRDMFRPEYYVNDNGSINFNVPYENTILFVSESYNYDASEYAVYDTKAKKTVAKISSDGRTIKRIIPMGRNSTFSVGSTGDAGTVTEQTYRLLPDATRLTSIGLPDMDIPNWFSHYFDKTKSGYSVRKDRISPKPQ